MKNTIAFIYKNIIAIGVGVIVAVECILILFALNKGFDFTDEGVYLLNYQNPSFLSLGGMKLLNRLFFGCSNLIFLRSLRFVLTVVCTYFFSVQCIKFYKKGEANTFLIFCIFLIFSFCSYAIFPLAIAYNSVSLLLGLLVVGFVFQYFNSQTNSIVKKNIPLLVAGIFCGVWLIVKTPSAVLVIFFCLFLLLFFHLKRIKEFAISSIALLSGCLFFLCYYFIFLDSLQTYLDSIKFASTLVGHSPDELLVGYQQDMIQLLKIVWLPVIVIAPNIILMINQRPWLTNFLKNCILALTAIELFYFLLISKSFLGGTANYDYLLQPFLVIILIATPSIIIKTFQQKKISIFKFLFNSFLLLLPFILSVGTNNRLFVNAFQYMIFWAAFIFLNSHYFEKKILLLIGLVIFSISFVQLATGLYKFPYRIFPLNEQTENFNPYIPNLKVDIGTKLFVDSCYTMIHSKTNFKIGDTIIALYNFPGLVYLLQGTSPGLSLYSATLNKANYAGLNLVHRPIQHLILIKPCNENIDSLMLLGFKNHGLNFPKDFTLLGTSYLKYRNQRYEIFSGNGN